MSEIVEIIDSLESKLKKLLAKIESLEHTLLELNANLKTATMLSNQQNQEIEMLKKKIVSLKMANSLLGSDENKKDTKLKINSLIREIDYCIAQLSE